MRDNQTQTQTMLIDIRISPLNLRGRAILSLFQFLLIFELGSNSADSSECDYEHSPSLDYGVPRLPSDTHC
ncbi:hypothetical protein CISIN_1g035191mg [Citrus sinensis]|uniref:Uncharacterized protein n=1 Tax=Citrus sinensis TaxID=2711 RepID=A0A067EL55_CITSI|nr:hypothetical protein CISIN_1g035191mg [Citrus sinensis]